MTNKETAIVFASGATQGRNSNGTLLIDGNTIYSYGKHWPLAIRDGNTAYINGDKYSVTTSRHTTQVAGRLSHAGFQLVYIGEAEMKERATA